MQLPPQVVGCALIELKEQQDLGQAKIEHPLLRRLRLGREEQVDTRELLIE